MNVILVAALLAAKPETPAARVTARQASAAIASQVETGTLLFSQGDCLAIRIYSASPYTHVAAVVVTADEALVYDAMGGAGVRRQSLSDYLAGQKGHSLYLFHPCQPFAEQRAQDFKRHLESQLGRPYAIRHHLTGERAKGLHCAEYVTDALIEADLLCAKQPPRVSPASLVDGILKGNVYECAATLDIIGDPPPRPDSDGWCARLWSETKHCTSACCCKFRGWFFCK